MKLFGSSLGISPFEATVQTPRTGSRKARQRSARRQAGFTLIELMIVVAIVAILSAIAYPSYTSYITKTHRVAAEGCLSEYSNYMERYYTTNLRYDQDNQATPVANPVSTTPPTVVLDCASAQQTGANYAYTVTGLSATGYTMQATPIGGQLSRDTKCATLTLSQTGTRVASTGDTTCW